MYVMYVWYVRKVMHSTLSHSHWILFHVFTYFTYNTYTTYLTFIVSLRALSPPAQDDDADWWYRQVLC